MIKKKRRESIRGVSVQKPPRDSEGNVGASEGRLTDAKGDNCRRVSALLRCSCKEALRRDKASAITIEPRGNSLLTCYTHIYMRAPVLARRVRYTTWDLGTRAHFFREFYFTQHRPSACAYVYVKKFGYMANTVDGKKNECDARVRFGENMRREPEQFVLSRGDASLAEY